MEFKEELAFTEFKDKEYTNSDTLKGDLTKKYKGIDVKKVFTSILNYQIDKYGTTLNTEKIIRKKVR